MTVIYTDSGYVLTDTRIVNNQLVLQSGKTTGTAVFPEHEADNNINECELRIKGDQFFNCTYRVSNDGGLSYETYTIGTKHTFNSVGNKLLIEMTLNVTEGGASPSVSKLNGLYT